MPFITPATYFLVLPHPDVFLSLPPTQYDDDTTEDSALPYSLLPTADVLGGESSSILASSKEGFALSLADKWRLVKPLLPKYMLPLCKAHLLANGIKN